MLTQFLKMLFYENGTPSLSRVMVALYFLLFAGVSVYLVIMAEHWASYETFAALAGGSSVAGQISNKFINSKYNSAPGSFESAQPTAPKGH